MFVWGPLGGGEEGRLEQLPITGTKVPSSGKVVSCLCVCVGGGRNVQRGWGGGGEWVCIRGRETQQSGVVFEKRRREVSVDVFEYCKHGNFNTTLIFAFFVHDEACGNLSRRKNNAYTLFIGTKICHPWKLKLMFMSKWWHCPNIYTAENIHFY